MEHTVIAGTPRITAATVMKTHDPHPIKFSVTPGAKRVRSVSLGAERQSVVVDAVLVSSVGAHYNSENTESGTFLTMITQDQVDHHDKI